MNISHFFLSILYLIEYLSSINLINCSNNNNTLAMVIFATPSSINYHFKRRSPRHVIFKSINLTNDNITSSTNQIHTSDISYDLDTFKDTTTFTKTQIKVIITVVIIISFIMLVIIIFRFKNTCRHQEQENLHTDIIRNRAAQYSEPSSRRGSVGYYTQKYPRTPDNHLYEQLNISLPNKRLSTPACDHSTKATAVVVCSSSTGRTDVPYHHHVTSSCDISILPDQQISNTSTLVSDIKSVTYKEHFPIGINLYDDQTPLITTEHSSTIKNSSNHTTRKYSLNALLPLVRPSNSHPFCSSLTSTNADGDGGGNNNGIDLKSRRRASLASALRRSSFAKQPRTFCSTVDSTTTTKTISPLTVLLDSDSSDRAPLSLNRSIFSKNSEPKKSSSLTPIGTTSLSSYPKAFMQKIERFRFIDDSASSTTTVTSPVESIERMNTHQACTHLITNAIDQFDDYIRTKYHHNTTDDDDDIHSLIDRLNSDLLTNGSYSDLNILNKNSSAKNIVRPQTFKSANGNSLQRLTNLPVCHQNEYQSSAPINIPHFVPSLPISIQRHQIETNGHTRSRPNKRDLPRPVALISTINETSSSSSTATLTSIRSLASLEFDDNTKPSGVLVDDDFLPMSSPVEEHFWEKPVKHHYGLNNNECFPNVGSSPDVEIKPFYPQQLHTLSETSCDEDDDDAPSMKQSEIFSIHEFKIKDLQKPLMKTKSISPTQRISEEIVSDQSSSTPSIMSTEQFSANSNATTTSFDQPMDESLSPKSSIPIRSDFLCDARTSQIISEEDDTQESSTNDASEGDDSADNGEIDLVQEFELSQKEDVEIKHSWTTDDHEIYLVQEDDLLSAIVTSPTTMNRTQPASIMKMNNNKTTDSIDEQLLEQQQQIANALRPKVRFNLDPQYEREREWNKVNKLLGNSVEWTDEFEV